MDVMTFLKGLPALVGVGAFFAYLWAGQYKIGGDLMKEIIEKLRVAPNVEIQNYAALTPARVEQLIERDAAVRSAVNDQDVKTIHLIVILQYAVTILVLLVSASLIALGIWLVTRPEPLSVVPQPPRAASAGGSPGPLVDLDPLRVEWETAGVVENVTVFLENVESNARTPKKTVLADVHGVTFSADEVHDVATTRDYHGKNIVRTVVEWPGKTVRSLATDLFVGIKVRLMIGGKLVTPKSATRSINTLIATIDDSTERMPKEYCFTVDFAGWNRAGAVVAPLKACNARSEVSLPFLTEIDWTRHVGIVFNEPSVDRPLVRLCIAGGSSSRQSDC